MSDLLVRAARVVPLDGEPYAEPVDVLVRSGAVAAVGRELPDAGVPEIDADGRWLVPGLWDAHVHLGQWAIASRRLDLSAARTPEEALAVVARAVDAGRPVVGMGHRAGTWSRPVTVAELDAVSGSVPVVLVNSDCHHGWLNTAGLDALGLARRDEVVSEGEWFDAYPRLTALVGGPTVDDYQRVLARAASRGVVGVVDFEFGAPWTDWASRWDEGCDLLRVRWSAYADTLDAALAAGLRTGAELAPGLSVGSLKIISDGSLGTRTAWCCEPYADTGGHGAPNQSAAELHDLLTRGTANGFTVATHAIGDRALAEALAVYAATGAAGSIEHAQLVTRDAVADLARLGLTASVQPAHLLDDRTTSERVWPGRGERSFALRWLRDAGVPIALGSDAPVAPLDPWLAISAAVHRGDPADEPWHPEQALSTGEALSASVDGRRTRVGEPGDLVLLDADPLAASPAALRDLSAALTVVGGRVVWGR
ncbi:amidohydrolase family protein [Nocardioides sp. CER19]|uniref:amidohydrolase n=1 Tax=Nocardioides sp. CER19 TaxID=3038538 RepID=UPI002449A4D4|nr:amidohydrolase family protein [Nocardioides sp. CER19]MDH2413164.1 amidohydrolase family protein [Nocardioides sp. CER19]